MNINVESSSPLRRKVTIELDQDEIGQELDRSYSELKRNVHLKGFRPGRAPRQIQDYEHLKVPQQTVEVSEADVDAAMQRLRERLAPLKKVEDRTRVEPGDFVIAELEAFAEGAPVPGSKLE